MLINRQFTLLLTFTLCSLAKCIIGTQSGWYFPPFESDKFQRKPRFHNQFHQPQFNHQQLYQLDPKVTTNRPKLISDGFDQQSSYSHERQSTDVNSIHDDMFRIKNYANYQSSRLVDATSRANEIEHRLAMAVDLTRRKRMHFFYGLMLHSYNYIRDLRIKGQGMIKDIRKQVNGLARLSRKAKHKMYKLTTKMETIEKLMVSSGDLEDKLNRSSEQFNDILNDFMNDVYKRKSGHHIDHESEAFIQQQHEEHH
ncbi:uncharacterized protein LOC128393583 [Panonychus citri]|uniref:uncharacterized protein LOC128393583 n=1 Tax=Panonychus citri TaxID=50023 RepID=UPI002307586D|nr:uncharacterized protein LOC128393583 [Panonychus citri]XP_053209747.1 uncharacterized protein LOC128393583 [Panonychus citri]XP_053209749.1 uncharacterized protein LOC128393583 [Panonychus citri]